MTSSFAGTIFAHSLVHFVAIETRKQHFLRVESGYGITSDTLRMFGASALNAKAVGLAVQGQGTRVRLNFSVAVSYN